MGRVFKGDSKEGAKQGGEVARAMLAEARGQLSSATADAGPRHWEVIGDLDLSRFCRTTMQGTSTRRQLCQCLFRRETRQKLDTVESEGPMGRAGGP